MGDQPKTQTHFHDATATATATTAISTKDPSPQPTPPSSPPPPPSKSPISKLPFRPRKIRKITTKSNTKTNDSTTTTTTTTTIIPHIRTLPTRNLSSAEEIELAIRHLRSSDPLLAPLIDTHLPPTFKSSNPPFLSLAKSILYQQLATKAATSIYTRFVSLCGGESDVAPDSVLSLNPEQLRQIGVSGRKASYLHDLANKYRNGILSDCSILELDDKSLFTMLTMVKGIGPWSVHMFMIFSLRRPDVLPIGDLGVRKGVQLLYGLEQLPHPSQVEQLCDKWRPYRSVGSWYMWRSVEAKGVPAIPAAVADTVSEQQVSVLGLVDPISRIANLGTFAWGQ